MQQRTTGAEHDKGDRNKEEKKFQKGQKKQLTEDHEQGNRGPCGVMKETRMVIEYPWGVGCTKHARKQSIQGSTKHVWGQCPPVFRWRGMRLTIAHRLNCVRDCSGVRWSTPLEVEPISASMSFQPPGPAYCASFWFTEIALPHTPPQLFTS